MCGNAPTAIKVNLMSVRTWNAGFGRSTVVFVMMLFWFLLILLGITQTSWRINAPAIVGLVFFGGCLYTWCLGFYYRLKKSMIKDKRGVS